MYNYKKLSLYFILDQYATRNAIVDFLSTDHSEFKNKLIKKLGDESKVSFKMNNYIKYLKRELEEIEVFLNDEDNVDWQILEINKKYFDELPRYKRRIEWFRSVDRYPFDYKVFFPND